MGFQRPMPVAREPFLNGPMTLRRLMADFAIARRCQRRRLAIAALEEVFREAFLEAIGIVGRVNAHARNVVPGVFRPALVAPALPELLPAPPHAEHRIAARIF